MALVGAPIMTHGAAPAAAFNFNDRERACVIKSPAVDELEWQTCWDGTWDNFCCKAWLCASAGFPCCIPNLWSELFGKVAMPTHGKVQTAHVSCSITVMIGYRRMYHR